MAIIVADVLNYKNKFRPLYEGQQFEVAGRLRLKAGFTPGNGDIYKFVRLGSGVYVDEIRVTADGELDGGGVPSLTGLLGIYKSTVDPDKAFNADSNPYLTPTTVSADDPDYFEDAAGLDTVLRAGGSFVLLATAGFTVTQDVTGFGGPVDVAITLDADASQALEEDIIVTVGIKGRTQLTAPGEFSGALAYRYEDRYDNSGESGGLVS